MDIWPHFVVPDGVVHAIVCGSRKWADCGTVSIVLEQLRYAFPVLTVIEGGADGADHCAALWASQARHRGVGWSHIRARWDEYPKYERWKAGHARNQIMIDMLNDAREAGHSVLVVAFKTELDGRLVVKPEKATGGTEDCLRRAWASDIPTWHCAETTPELLLQNLQLGI